MRVAVFVDAGYLYAEGAKAVEVPSHGRDMVDLAIPGVLDKLKTTAREKAGSASLLRIYWYDGVRGGVVSTEQNNIADSDDVKLRLGTVSPFGQQKGVDSLIVTDLVELARNQVISDAVLLSGDEDVRIGVQLAQNFGVRVHLLGIESKGGNQARTLRQEADTTTEWSRAEIGEFLTPKATFHEAAASKDLDETSDNDGDTTPTLDDVIVAFVDILTSGQLNSIAALGERDSIPYETDSLLLGRSKGALDRDLDHRERQYLRHEFKKAVRRVLVSKCSVVEGTLAPGERPNQQQGCPV